MGRKPSASHVNDPLVVERELPGGEWAASKHGGQLHLQLQQQKKQGLLIHLIDSPAFLGMNHELDINC